MSVALNPIGSNGGIILQDNVYPWKVFGGFGDGIRAWALGAGTDSDDTTNSPQAFIATQGGTSPLTVGEVQGYPLLLTTGATEYNGSNIQLRGATAKLVAAKQAFLRGKFKLSDATQSDFLFGLCQLKTDLLKTSVAHGVNTSVEGVFFFKADGATTIYAKAYKAGTEETSVSVGTMSTSDIDYAIWWDGSKVHFYINNVEVTSFAGTLPDQVLTPSLNVRAGEAAAKTLSIAELAYVEVE